MGQYYYLISGLPEIQLEDQKLKLTLSDFKAALKDQVSNTDWKVLRYFFMQYDNVNLLRYLRDKESVIDELGDLSKDDLTEIVALFKESDYFDYPNLPLYFNQFVPNYIAEEKSINGLSWSDQLSSLYFKHGINCKNSFVSEWFDYNLNVTNVLTAISCVKHGYDKQKAIVGYNEISEIIRTSNSRDFGIRAEFPEVEEILRIAEESDLYERERKIDWMKWEWLEEKGFFHYFDVEHLFVYLVRLQLLTRWVQLEKETGKQVFRNMIAKLQSSFEFPNEFTVKKVASV